MKKTKAKPGYTCPVCAGKAKAITTCPRCLQEQCPRCRGALLYCANCDVDVRFRAAAAESNSGRLAGGCLPPKGAAVCSCNAANPSWDKCLVHAPKGDSDDGSGGDEADRRDTGEPDGGVLEPGPHDEGSPVGHYQI